MEHFFLWYRTPYCLTRLLYFQKSLHSYSLFMDIPHELRLKDCFEKYADSLYRLCLFRLHGDEMTASDLVQESFYRAGLALKQWKEIENLKAFIFRIASNLIIDLSRKVQIESLDEKSEEEIFIPEATQVSPVNQAHAQIELDTMYQILEKLPSEDKDIFLLRYVEEVPPREIAHIFWLDINTVTVRLHRLKKKVSDSLSYSL